MKVTNAKECYCYTCAQAYHYLGINMHRAMHRSRGETCKIRYTHRDTYTFHYGKKKGKVITKDN